MFAARVVRGLRSRSPAEISQFLKILVRNALGLPNPIRTPDRTTLEQVILPAYASRDDIKSVLFVGCDYYTRHYEKMFAGKTYATIDPDQWKHRFGARSHHVIGMERIDAHFAPGSLDLVVCNGVFGWGLNERTDVERAFDNCFACLREGGHLVIGWNDVPERRPLALDSLTSLARFQREPFPALGNSHYLATPDTGHTFEFFVKPAASITSGRSSHVNRSATGASQRSCNSGQIRTLHLSLLSGGMSWGAPGWLHRSSLCRPWIYSSTLIGKSRPQTSLGRSTRVAKASRKEVRLSTVR